MALISVAQINAAGSSRFGSYDLAQVRQPHFMHIFMSSFRRPWYVETSSPIPKDVVLVIDKSLSMTDTYDQVSLLSIAKRAAISVIETLNPRDRVRAS